MKFKKRGVYQRYNQNLLDRIDNMKDASDFNPYNAEKKHTVEDSELFGNKNYTSDEDEDTDEGYEYNQTNVDDDYTISNKFTIAVVICIIILIAVIIKVILG